MKTLYGIPEGQDAFVLKDRAWDAQRKGAVALHVALDDARALTLATLLNYFAPDVDVLIYPAWDSLPYDRVSPQGEEPVQDVNRTRLWLNDATSQVLANGLELLGVSAPERM